MWREIGTEIKKEQGLEWEIYAFIYYRSLKTDYYPDF